MIQELKALAADHWRTYLPTKWAALVAADRVDLELTQAATLAEQQIRELMRKGAREDEAREMVLPDLIYLPPEASGLSPEAQEEEAELEEEYQRTVGQPMSGYLREVMEQDDQERLTR